MPDDACIVTQLAPVITAPTRNPSGRQAHAGRVAGGGQLDGWIVDGKGFHHRRLPSRSVALSGTELAIVVAPPRPNAIGGSGNAVNESGSNIQHRHQGPCGLTHNDGLGAAEDRKRITAQLA